MVTAMAAQGEEVVLVDIEEFRANILEMASLILTLESAQTIYEDLGQYVQADDPHMELLRQLIRNLRAKISEKAETFLQ